jgi:hypothetical protein
MAQFMTLASESVEMVGVLIPVVAVGGGLMVGMVSIVAKAIRRTAETRHKEESRREIAAYVAEGSMSPDDAYKILSAGTPVNPKDKCC